MHLTELSSAKTYHEKRAHQNRNIRNGSGALHQGVPQSSSSSSHPHQHHHQRSRAQYLASAEENNTRSLPRHFKLAAQKQQSSSLTAQSFYDASKDKLYVTKAIALICPLPYVHATRYFLTGLYK